MCYLCFFGEGGRCRNRGVAQEAHEKGRSLEEHVLYKARRGECEFATEEELRAEELYGSKQHLKRVGGRWVWQQVTEPSVAIRQVRHTSHRDFSGQPHHGALRVPWPAVTRQKISPEAQSGQGNEPIPPKRGKGRTRGIARRSWGKTHRYKDDSQD